MWGICSRESCRMFSTCRMLPDCSRSVCKRQPFLKMPVCCTKGKLLDTGLKYIQYWKQHEELVKSEDMEEHKQKYLESCALHYHEVNDKRTMMYYVRAFDSMSLIRTFLWSVECFDELLTLEEESGNFFEAAKIAKLSGDLLHGADLLAKGAQFKEAVLLVLWFGLCLLALYGHLDFIDIAMV